MQHTLLLNCSYIHKDFIKLLQHQCSEKSFCHFNHFHFVLLYFLPYLFNYLRNLLN